MPCSRPKRSDLYTQLLENHTLHSGTYLYSPNPPPPGIWPGKILKMYGWDLHSHRRFLLFPSPLVLLIFSHSLASHREGLLPSRCTRHPFRSNKIWESLSPIHSSDMSFFIEKRAGFIEHNGLKYWQLGQPVDGMFVFVPHDTVLRDKDKGQNFCHTFKFQYTWLHPKYKFTITAKV